MTLRILIAALTCIIGIGGVLLWPTGPLPSLSLCDLSRNVSSYEGKVVRVRGELSVSAQGEVLLGVGERVPGAGGRECGASAVVFFRDHPGLIDELKELNATWMYRGGSAKAGVVLSGRFEDRPDSCPSEEASDIIRDAVLEQLSLID